jgi:cytidine deaminase
VITEIQLQELLEKAELAARHTYSPYSKFAVGAAVLTRDGAMHLGTNVENASYGLTICAERVAICSAVAAGSKDIVAVAVHGGKDGVTPCGACRQFIAEFGRDVRVIYRRHGRILNRAIQDLLPDSFCKEELDP